MSATTFKYLHHRFGLELLKQCNLDYFSTELALQYAAVRGTGMKDLPDAATKWLASNRNNAVLFLYDKFSKYLELLNEEFRSTWCNANHSTPVMFSKNCMDAVKLYITDIRNNHQSVDKLDALRNIEHVMSGQIDSNRAHVAHHDIYSHKQLRETDAFDLLDEIGIIENACTCSPMKSLNALKSSSSKEIERHLQEQVAITSIRYMTRVPDHAQLSRRCLTHNEMYDHYITCGYYEELFREAIRLYRPVSGLAPELVVGHTIWLPKVEKRQPHSLVERFLITRFMARALVDNEY